MTHFRLALAIALLMISGPTLAAVVLTSSIGSYGSVSFCAREFETVYVEDLQEGEWRDWSASTRDCN